MIEDIHTPRTLLTVRQFSERHPAFPESGLRYLIFNAKPRTRSSGDNIPGNGLEESGAIVRLGRKVLLDEQRFESPRFW